MKPSVTVLRGLAALSATVLLGCQDTHGVDEQVFRAISDTFDGPLDAWQVTHPHLAQFGVTDGVLTVQPVRHTAWHAQQTAFGLHQSVDGDFSVTTDLEVSTLTGGAPEPLFRLAGLQIRTTNLQSVQAYEGSMGSAAPWLIQGLAFHTKTTVAGVSQYMHMPHPSGAGQIRLCRVGSTLRAMFRTSPADPWTIADERTRNELAGPVEVGPIAYDYNGAANFEARFDHVSFRTISSMDDCASDPPSSTDSGTLDTSTGDAPVTDTDTSHGDAGTDTVATEGTDADDGDTDHHDTDTETDHHATDTDTAHGDTDSDTDTDTDTDGDTDSADAGEVTETEGDPTSDTDSALWDGSDSIVVDGARYRFVGNSFLALMNLHVEAVIAANTGAVIDTYPGNGSSASASNGYDGWFYGQGLWEMDPAVDLIAAEGNVDTCAFLSGPLEDGDPRTPDDDDEPLGGMLDFVEAVSPHCENIVLYLTWGAYGASPTRNPSDYDQVIGDYIASARILEDAYPNVITVPMALVFHDLQTDPPIAVPRADYLHRPNRDPHQNMLGTVLIAWTFYAALADASPIGATYDYNDVFGPDFIVDGLIGLGNPTTPFSGGAADSLPFDEATQELFQSRVHDLVTQWRTRTSSFDAP